MAGDYVPVYQLLCKLQILQGRLSLLPAKLSTRSFLLSLGTEDSSSLIFRIFHTSEDAKLPNSPCFPRRFGLKQVRKVYSKFAAEGKITLELVNFSVNSSNSVLCPQPITTQILVSEASPDGLYSLLSYFSPSAPCHSTMSLPPSRLLGLSLDIFSVLYACLGPVDGKKLRLVNKRLHDQVGEVVRVLKIGKGGDAELVRRVMERCTGLRELTLQGYKGASTALTGLLRVRTGLVTVNLPACRLADSFLAALLPSSTTLEELQLTGFSAAALTAFLPSCVHIRTLNFSELQLNSALLHAIQTLPDLTTLSIQYTGLVPALLCAPAWSSCLSTVSCLPSCPVLSPALRGLWTSLIPCHLQAVGCDIDLSADFGSLLDSVRTLWSCSLPLQPLPNLFSWTVYIAGEDMLEWLEVHGAWLSRLQRLTVMVPNDWLAPVLTQQLGQVLGKGKAAVKVVHSPEKKGGFKS